MAVAPGAASSLLIHFNAEAGVYELIVPNTDIFLTFTATAADEAFGVQAFATFMTDGLEAAQGMAQSADVIFADIETLGFGLDEAFFSTILASDYIEFGGELITLMAGDLVPVGEAIEAAGEALLMFFV